MRNLPRKAGNENRCRIRVGRRQGIGAYSPETPPARSALASLEPQPMPEAQLASPSVDGSEVAKFAALAEQWWDPAGTFAPLHKFNPVPLNFIRDPAAPHSDRDDKPLRPSGGLSLLVPGGGGGLRPEPMARLGFEVTGCDAAEETVH